MEYLGKVVAITGGGSGIGKLMAERFARKGAAIAVIDLNHDAALQTVDAIRAAGGVAEAYQLDVSSREDVYKTFYNIAHELGPVHTLINNAGIVAGKPLMQTPDALIEKTIAVNMTSHFWTIKAVLPTMLKKNEGHIVSIASSAAFAGVPQLIDYCAAKSGAYAINDALRVELQRTGVTGVRTTVVCPYYINTGMFDGVKSWLLPILQPNDVVNAIVDAVLHGRPEIIIPNLLTAGRLLKVILPTALADAVLKVAGFSSSMADFKGRHEVPSHPHRHAHDPLEDLHFGGNAELMYHYTRSHSKHSRNTLHGVAHSVGLLSKK